MVKRGFLIGVTAALASAIAMFLSRAVLKVPSAPEVLIDVVTAVLPLALFSHLLGWLGGWAKPLLAVGLAVMLVIGGGALGVLWSWGEARLLRRGRSGEPLGAGRVTAWSRWGYGLAFSFALWVLAMAMLLPFVEEVSPGVGSSFRLAIIWLAYTAVYGAMLAAASYRRWSLIMPTEDGPLPANIARRRFIQRLGLITIGAIAAAGLGRYVWMVVVESGKTATSMLAKLSPEITPNEDFYTVSKNFFDPKVDASTWKLIVEGLVERPLALTYEQLKERPSVTQFLTLECISNEVGGDLIGNAEWQGVPLHQLLSEAGVNDSAREVVLFGADGYSDSIPLEKAMAPGTLIAYEMNGVSLPDEHGFPARLLVPGIYGMKNVKWLTRIELVDYDYQGYWQRRGWSDSAVIETMSRIDVPQEYIEYNAGDVKFIGGVAFAGDQGVTQVEISTDGGQNWTKAQVKEALSPYTWVLWTQEWIPPAPGDYTLKVRATDKRGGLQYPAFMEPLPDGATGYHTIVIHIVEL